MKPNVTVIANRSQPTIGEHVRLICGISQAVPPVRESDIVWTLTSMHEDRPVRKVGDSDPRVKVSDSGRTVDIQDIQPGDAAVYACTATNPAGTARAEHRILVNGKLYILPACLQSLNVLLVLDIHAPCFRQS